MNTYLVTSQSASSQDFRVVQATDLTDLFAKIKPQLGAGLSINNGQRETLTVSVTRLNAAAQITPNANAGNATVVSTTDIQAAIADLPAGATAATIRTAFNTLLVELRAAEIIA